MKRLFLIFALMMLNFTLAAQVLTQKGISYRYNGKNPRTPLPNVTVECVTANNAVVSDDSGTFTLTFNSLKMGDRIGLVTVKKLEMMVFNQHAIDEWSIRKEPLCLILCDADEFDRQKKEYMELGRKDAKLKYDREKATLERQLEEGKIKQEDLENALNVAYERLKKLQEEIDKYADDLARIDLSELDDKMQDILEAYQRGETQKAIEMLKSLKLAEEFDKETVRNEAVQQELQRSDSKLQTLVEQMKSSVALLKNSGEWEEASKYLKRIADKTNTLDALFEYAVFCQSQNNFKEAETYYQKALPIVRELAQVDRQAYEPDLATTLCGLGLLHIQQEQYLQAISNFEEAVAVYRQLKVSNPSYGYLYQYSFYWLSQLYSTTGNHKRHYEINEEWLPVGKGLYQEDAESYQKEYIAALGSQSFQCIFVGQLEKSEQYAREALAIDSSQHWINTNLAASLLLQGKYDEAEAIYRQYKGELKDGFLGDFNDFEAAGVIPEERKADVERIRKMLTEE